MATAAFAVPAIDFSDRMIERHRIATIAGGKSRVPCMTEV